MARRQTQNTKNTKARKPYVDPYGGFGRGANIRLVAGDIITQSNPKAFKALSGRDRYNLVGAICNQLGIPTKENGLKHTS